MSSDAVTELRCAGAADAVAIRELVRAAYAKWIPLIGREPMPMLADYARAVREHQIDILWSEGRMTGLIETMLRPDHLWIENVAVRPDCQGQGFGRLLMAHAESRAAEAGLCDIRLQTNGAFAANITFYEGLGYGVERREPFMDGWGVRMKKVLPPAPSVPAPGAAGR
jgi:ribosomal protein S18 acetylase RimI-like enzyme